MAGLTAFARLMASYSVQLLDDETVSMAVPSTDNQFDEDLAVLLGILLVSYLEQLLKYVMASLLELPTGHERDEHLAL